MSKKKKRKKKKPSSKLKTAQMIVDILAGVATIVGKVYEILKG